MADNEVKKHYHVTEWLITIVMALVVSAPAWLGWIGDQLQDEANVRITGVEARWTRTVDVFTIEAPGTGDSEDVSYYFKQNELSIEVSVYNDGPNSTDVESASLILDDGSEVPIATGPQTIPKDTGDLVVLSVDPASYAASVANDKGCFVRAGECGEREMPVRQLTIKFTHGGTKTHAVEPKYEYSEDVTCTATSIGQLPDAPC